jgi:hypothetical protein
VLCMLGWGFGSPPPPPPQSPAIAQITPGSVTLFHYVRLTAFMLYVMRLTLQSFTTKDVSKQFTYIFIVEPKRGVLQVV